MSFAKKLGKSYEMVRDQAKTKKITIELGEVKFNLTVRIPLKREMESLMEKISNPSPEKVNEIYTKLTQSLKKSLDDGKTWSAPVIISGTAGYSDHPLLINQGDAVYLSWLTRDDGYQLIPLN